MTDTMHGVHTHYDNLRVSRDAHPKIIRAAYKKLSRQYHPDHNQNNPEATKVMQVINLAYDVLSDPVRRKEHDEWIARMESERQNRPAPSYEPFFKQAEQSGFRFRREGVFHFAQAAASRAAAGQPPKNPAAPNFDKKAVGEHLFRHWFWYVLIIAVIVGFGYHSYSKNVYNPLITASQHQIQVRPGNGKPQSTQDSASPNPGGMHYARPAAAPDGRAWPANASYLSGFRQENLNGMSSVTIGNNFKGSDVMVKLFALEFERSTAVRVFYIPANETFRVEKLSPGLYDIRFLDLKSGQLFRTEPFELQENTLANGTRHTSVSMTLKHENNGQAALQSLSPENF